MKKLRKAAFEKTDRKDYYKKHSPTNFFSSKDFDQEEATKYYEKQWKEVFKIINSAKPPYDVVFLNPVGTGVFDPSNGSELTKASAIGFSKALLQALKINPKLKTRFVLPLYDTKKVLPHYCDELKNEIESLEKLGIDKTFSTILDQMKMMAKNFIPAKTFSESNVQQTVLR